MNTPHPAGGHRRSWRGTPESQSTLQRSKRVTRIAASSAALLLLAALGFVLILPFLHPNVHLVCLPVDYSDLSVPPIAYVQQDIDALRPLKSSLYSDDKHPVPDVWTNLKNSAAIKGLGENLKGLVKPKEVLIFYLQAHGVSDDGTAYLLCSDFDPTRPSVGRYKLDDLLSQICSSPGKLKLVILDAGRILGDPRLGMVFNEFPSLLEQAVKDCREPNLWVLSAASLLEQSHLWHSQKRSVFGHFVTEGLKGGADQDKNHKIELAELVDYVGANVSSWVKKYGDGEGDTQTPVLLRGGMGPAAPEKKLLLMPVPGGSVAAAPAKQPETEPAQTPDSKSSEQQPAKTSSRLPRAPGSGLALLASAFQQPASREAETKSRRSGAGKGVPPQENPETGAGAAAAAGTQKQAEGKTGEAAAPPPEGTPKTVPAQEPEKLATPPSPPEPTDLRGLLDRAWKLRDDIETRDDRRWTPSPVDYAPHLWREYLELLLEYEALSRFGSADSSRDLSKQVRELTEQMRVLATPRQPLADPRAARSLAAARLIVAASDELRVQQLEKLQDALDATSRSLSPDEIRNWAGELRESDAQLVELNLVRRFGKIATAGNWTVIQAALQTSRTAELAAGFAEWCEPWVRQRIDGADQDRLAGLRELLSGFRQAEQRAAPLLDAAAKNSEQSLRDVTTVARAIRLKNDLLFRAPYYVHWYAHANLDHSSAVPAYSDLADLLKGLRKLTDELNTLEPGNLARIDQHRAELERIRNLVESPLTPEFVANLLKLVKDNPGEPGNTRKIEDRLATPLLAGPLRMKLIDALDQLELRWIDEPGSRSAVSTRTLSGAEFKRLKQIAELQVLLVQLADPAAPGQQTALDEIAAGLLSLTGGTKDIADLRKLGSSLQGFYRTLPPAIEQCVATNQELTDRESRRQRLDALRMAQHTLWIIDPRDAHLLKNLDLIGTVRKAQLYDLMAWHSQRFATASKAFDSPADAQYFTASAETLRRLANTLNGPEISAPGAGPTVAIKLDGDTTLKLPANESRRLDVKAEVLNAAGVTGNPMVTLRFDRALVKISSQAGQEIEPGKEQSWGTFTMKQGAKGVLQYRLEAKKDPSDPETKVFVQVSAGGKSFIHETTVLLPVPDPVSLVVFPSVPETAVEENRKTQLRPFPNKVTPYRFDLVNSSDTPQTISKVELLAVPRPPSGERRLETLPFDKNGNLMPGFELPLRLAATEKPLTIEPNGKVPIPFAPFKPEPPATGPSVRYGLIWLITPENGPKSVKRMDIAPLRPKNYVEADVSYERERINFNVKRRGNLPPDGCKIRLEYEVDPRTAKAGLKKLDGDLVAPRFETDLYLQVDRNPKTNVTLKLSVDNYPRVLVYRVSCAEDRQHIRPIEETAIRFTSPENGKPFAAPRESVPVEFEVDAPDDAFDSERNLIEVGIDENQDREFQAENPLRIFSNRDFDILVSEITAEGVVRLDTKVGNFKLDLPTHGLARIRPGVLGIMHVDEEIIRSNPLEIWLDETPPVISNIKPQGATAGQPVRVAVQAEDPESGVAFVEFAFDLEDRGKFPKEPPPVRGQADKSSPGLYRAELKTEGFAGGLYTLLIRATNSVDIASEFVPVQVKVSAAPMAKTGDGAETKLSTVSGRVLCVDKPVPNCKVRMTGANNFSQARETDAKGMFLFEKIPAGSYELSAQGLCNNSRRRGDASIEVDPPKPVVKDLKLTDLAK